MAVIVEASNASVPGDDMYHANNAITANETFANISNPKGIITPTTKEPISDTRIHLSVDWDSCPEGDGRVTFNISSSQGYGLRNHYNMPSVYLPYSNRRVPDNFKGYAESGKYVSTEVSHSSCVRGAVEYGPRYRTLQGYGKTLAGVELVPFDADSQTPSSGPVLEYDFFAFTFANRANITVRLGPSLDADPKRPLRYAVAIDDAEPEIRQYITDLAKGDPPAENWYVTATNNGWDVTTEAIIARGEQHVLKLWALEPGVIFKKIIIDLRGGGGVKYSYLGPPESTRVGY